LAHGACLSLVWFKQKMEEGEREPGACTYFYPPTTRVRNSAKRYPARIILLSAIRLALTT
jgi:hypothetical protein